MFFIYNHQIEKVLHYYTDKISASNSQSKSYAAYLPRTEIPWALFTVTCCKTIFQQNVERFIYVGNMVQLLCECSPKNYNSMMCLPYHGTP
jgi:hypothetical protein